MLFTYTVEICLNYHGQKTLWIPSWHHILQTNMSFTFVEWLFLNRIKQVVPIGNLIPDHQFGLQEKHSIVQQYQDFILQKLQTLISQQCV